MRFLLLILVLSAATAVSAQTTFEVTVVTKTAAHPYVGQGHPEGYAIDGVQGAVLTLQRGQTYTFQMVNVSPVHPFYISTDAAGGGAAPYTSGVTGTPASGTASVTFTVPASAPNELWYQCSSHTFMGFRLSVIGTLSGEAPAGGYALRPLSANPGRGEVRVSVTLPTSADAVVEVFAADGRRVAVVHEGVLAGGAAQALALDTRGLAAGVYVLRARSGAWEARQTITVIR
ncbi:MAG TPA: cupredoxin domain-containing protein [Rubricoccaceae bacterium]|jgi:hypothetical protein